MQQKDTLLAKGERGCIKVRSLHAGLHPQIQMPLLCRECYCYECGARTPYSALLSLSLALSFQERDGSCRQHAAGLALTCQAPFSSFSCGSGHRDFSVWARPRARLVQVPAARLQTQNCFAAMPDLALPALLQREVLSRCTRALHLLSRWVCERAEGVRVLTSFIGSGNCVLIRYIL